MRFLVIGLVFFAFAAPAFGRVPPDDPVPVPPVAIFWTDGPAPDVPAATPSHGRTVFVPPPCHRPVTDCRY